MKKEEVSEILWIAVFLNEKNDHWICFAHWSLSTVFCDRSVSYRCQGWHPTPCFEFLSAGIFSILALLLDQSKTSPIPAGCLSCHLHLHGLACGDFWWQWSMLWPVPLSVWCALVGDLAWTTWSQWVCPWWFAVWRLLSHHENMAIMDLCYRMIIVNDTFQVFRILR